ncbi:HAD-IA family hydrolase [Sandaracinobacteroides hominis]|uniref:HAD-IA family hydrolase n=1 Tax=Sandaracinobacteroides hominis TaxID=2780086 RepID=UPI0018F29336|nr:HAD-IA family hydrolase [Sandaracinobacteroides hominis]
MSRTYTAILFDFGGVITSSPFDAFNRYEAQRGLPHNFIRTVNATNPDSNAWARFERSEITAEQFDQIFTAEADALGQEVRGADVIALLAGDIRPRMVAALDTLKAQGYKLGCITNNAPTGHGPGMTANAEKANAIAEVMQRFDHIIESSKAGIRKPDPRIYTRMTEALGVAPAECIYLDDLGINCKPAATLGMTAIKVNGEEQALEDLNKLLGTRL